MLKSINLPTIVLDCRPLYNGHRFRGIGYVVNGLVPELVKFPEYRFSLLTYVGTNPVIDLQLDESIKIIHVNRPFLKERLEWLWDLLFLWRICSQLPAGSWVHFFSLQWSFGLRNVIFTVHDLFPLTNKSYQKPFDQWVRWSILKLLFKRARFFVCVSIATAIDLGRFLGQPVDKITVAHNAVEPAFRPLTVASKHLEMKRLGILKPYLLSVGGLDGYEPRKNIYNLLETFHTMIEKDALDLDLVLIGKIGGETKQFITDYLKEHNLVARVHLPGFVDQNDYIAYVQLAYCYLNLSLAEGFGLPLLQSIACGVPVISYRNSSAFEVLGEAGIFITDDKSDIVRTIKAILYDSDYHEQFRQKLLAQAENFSWAETAKIYQLYYQAVIRPTNLP